MKPVGMKPWMHRSLIVGFAFYVVGLLCLPIPARAEDIDIFLINPSITSLRPNVLIVLDNSANWSSTDTVGGGSKYENVRKALSRSIENLSNQFNVGLMLFGETGTGNDSINGGVMRAAVRNLDTTYKPKLKALFDTIDGNKDKTNNTAMGLAFAEAYYYFTGQTAVSGLKLKRDYHGNSLPTTSDPTLVQSNAIWALTGNALTGAGDTTYEKPITDACQKNFIIFIANGVVNDNISDNADATNKLSAAGGNTDTIVLTENDGQQANITDEWARFLSNSDLLPDETNWPGKQSITSYTIEVNPLANTAGLANSQLLKSIADQGKGKYFAVSSASEGEELSEALNKIFAEVLAVNSVFASSTLPVSVNVRGTFLNQVYMGVFRPDSNSSPRWAGNVKQYTLKETAAGELVLADMNANPVENSASGFVSPSARSFWTSETTTFWNTTYYPDARAQAPLTPTTADAPDGEFVEKGGAAQQLRQAHLTDVTTRKLYTCIDCAADTELATSHDQHFEVDNSNITEAMLGITGAKSITSLTRSGTTATAVSSSHDFLTGQVVTVSGANQPQYNGSYSVTKIDADTFSYTITESPATPATSTGTIYAAKPNAPTAILLMTRSGTTVTVTTAANHGYTSGQNILITGADQASYNGSKIISTSGGNTFTFTVAETPVTPATVAGTATVGTVSKNIKANPSVGVERVGTTVTIETTNNHGFTSGSSVAIAGVTPSEYNGTFTIASVPTAKTFTYSIASTAIGPASPATGTSLQADAAVARTVTSLARSGTTATVTTSAAHGFTTGNSITISGATQTEYNGTFPITSTGTSTFTYQVPVNPATTATGTITAIGAGGVLRASLMNWVRGANTRLDDNPTSEATRVRGYLHGDVLHSRPAVVNYNRTGQPVDRDVVLYYGSNDGIIHAVKGGQDLSDGFEKWGFVPREFFDRFIRLYSESPIISSINTRPYFADGPISVDAVYVNDRIEGTGAKAQIYVGMRRGGRVYYSLDVTTPDNPLYKWKIDNTVTGFAELGQTWSEAKVSKINVKYPDTTAAARKVLVFGAGYDAAANDPVTQGTASMGRGIFIVDATSGALIWHASPRAPGDVTMPANAIYQQVSGMNYAIPANLTVIDTDFDANGYADRIYATDTGGNIWRVNIGDTDRNNWTVDKVAALSGTNAADKRKFLFGPDVVSFDTATDSILVGSGDREQPFDVAINNRFYMIKDAHGLNARPAAAVTETDLCDLTDNNLQGSDQTAADIDRACLANTAKRGWMIRLGTGEKTVTGATTLGGTTIFATNTPASEATPGQCTGSLGKALIYTVDFKDATSTIDYNADGSFGQGERATVREGGGFPPDPTPTAVKIGDSYFEGAILGTRVVNPPQSALGQRYRVFWNMSVDN